MTAEAQVEVEADPIAYILNGYSGHLAYRMDSYRASFGVFAADVPEFFHGNDGWDFRASGATAKFDYLFSGLNGAFVGLDTGYQRSRYEVDGASTNRDGFSAGLRTGYRFPLGRSGLFVVPWVSVSYQFENDDVHLNGETFEGSPIFIFPTVHLGWRF